MKKISLILSAIVVIVFIVGAYTYFSKNSVGVASSCTVKTGSCNGTTEVECVKDWLERSGCFRKAYIDEHFTNFRFGGTSNSTRIVDFDFLIGGKNVCEGGFPTCGAAVNRQGAGWNVETVYGPLREYELSIDENRALELLKQETECADVNTNFGITLRASDEFHRNEFAFNPDGLRWSVWTGDRCGRECRVDARTGTLHKGKYQCE